MTEKEEYGIEDLCIALDAIEKQLMLMNEWLSKIDYAIEKQLMLMNEWLSKIEWKLRK